MDFRSPRRNLGRIQNHFNRKGLVSENGIKKEAFYVLKDFYKELEDAGKQKKMEKENYPKTGG